MVGLMESFSTVRARVETGNSDQFGRAFIHESELLRNEKFYYSIGYILKADV